MSRRRIGDRGADRGAVLVLVLILVVVGGFVVLPLMDYSVTAMRANRTLNAQTANSEAVKGGLRAALANPLELFADCASTEPVTLALPTAADVTTTCVEVDSVSWPGGSEAGVGVHETWEGSEPPAGFTDPTWQPEEYAGEWWEELLVPDLPTGGLVARRVPDPDPTCRIFYPGRYTDPITIDGPAYFASGVYSFEQPLTLLGGARVIAGADADHGAIGGDGWPGCSDDATAAAAWADEAPHHISGLGVTFVLGGDGRLIVDDRHGPITFTMHPRYAEDGATDASSVLVSIVSVDGQLSVDGVSVEDLVIPGSLHVPAADTNPGDRPSTVVPDAAHPNRPTIVNDLTFPATLPGGGPAVIVSWQAPRPGPYPVERYRVLLDGNEVTCAGAPMLVGRPVHSCAVPVGGPGTYTLTVVASNQYGDGPGATTPPVAVPAPAPAVDVPAPPTAVALVGDPLLPTLNGVTVTPYHDALVVTWQPPADDGGAPITGYTAETNLLVNVEDLIAGLATGGLLDSLSNTIATALYNQLEVESQCTSVGACLAQLGVTLYEVVACLGHLLNLPALLECLVGQVLQLLVGDVVGALNALLPNALNLSGLPLLTQLDTVIRAVLSHTLVPVLGRLLGALDGDPDDSTLDLGGVASCSAIEDMVAAPVALPDPERFCVIHLSPDGLDVLGLLDQALGVDLDVLLEAPLIDALIGELDAALVGITGPLVNALTSLLGINWLSALGARLNLTTVVDAVRGNLASVGVIVEVTAHNAVGPSQPVTTLLGVNLLGHNLCDPAGPNYEPAYCPTATEYVPDVVLDVVTNDPGSTVSVPGYVSLPQGVVRMRVGNGGTRFTGGLVGAYLDDDDSCRNGTVCSAPEESPPEVVQRTLRITSRIAGSAIQSDAVVQVNRNGAWAINTWVVQPVRQVD